MKRIRWWGLAAFMLLVVAPVVAIALYADRIVENTVEHWGTHMNEAKVELDGARLSFTPLGFELTNLQVTNARVPMRNAVQVERIRFAVDLYPLLRRKFVITDMSMEGVRINTPRTTSGAVPRPPEPEPEPAAEKSFEFPNADLPDLKDLVDTDALKTNQLIARFRTELDTAQAQWQARLNDLPEKSVLEQYERRIAQAKPSFKGNALQDAQEIADGIKQLEAVRDDIRKDIERINAVRRAVGDDWTTWSNNTRELLAAPGADLEQLKGKYSLDAKGFTNVSRALFGAQVADWTGLGIEWYGKIAPYLAAAAETKEPGRKRMKGIDVRFEERDRLPDFLIRSMKLSVDVTAGKMRGEVRNVTHDQPTLGHPLTFSFFGEKMHGVQDVEIEGTLNHVVPRAAQDRIQIRAHGIAIDSYDIVRAKSFPVTLRDAEVDFDAFVELKESTLLNAGMNFDFRKARLAAEVGSSAGELGQVIANALADIRRFGVTAKLGGTLRDWNVELRSDLDESLRTALTRQFKQRADAFIADARARLEAKVDDARRQIDAKLENLRSIEQQVEQRKAQAEAQLIKAEDELRAAIDKAKADAERQKKEAGEKLKDQAQDKLKDAAGSLKDRLKKF